MIEEKFLLYYKDNDYNKMYIKKYINKKEPFEYPYIRKIDNGEISWIYIDECFTKYSTGDFFDVNRREHYFKLEKAYQQNKREEKLKRILNDRL